MWDSAAMTKSLLTGPLQVAGVAIESWETGAKLYFSMWGPLGRPAVEMVETIAAMQREVVAGFAGLTGVSGDGV